MPESPLRLAWSNKFPRGARFSQSHLIAVCRPGLSRGSPFTLWALRTVAACRNRSIGYHRLAKVSASHLGAGIISQTITPKAVPLSQPGSSCSVWSTTVPLPHVGFDGESLRAVPASRFTLHHPSFFHPDIEKVPFGLPYLQTFFFFLLKKRALQTGFQGVAWCCESSSAFCLLARYQPILRQFSITCITNPSDNYV